MSDRCNGKKECIGIIAIKYIMGIMSVHQQESSVNGRHVEVNAQIREKEKNRNKR
jgi:hypothetical protein